MGKGIAATGRLGSNRAAASPMPVPSPSLPRQRHLATYTALPFAARLTLVPALLGKTPGSSARRRSPLADPGASPAAP
ncbi:hypothetical protein AB0451_31805 [Streptomyces sp. NPDC052000]|uniref:hypothetical protein n=1 Tax=Streptomyces sp. NPDC052000 TaxID=3155676 RepID=UPI00344F7557